MENKSQDTLRAVVEGALTRRLQDLDDDIKTTCVHGLSLGRVDGQFAEDMAYIRSLLPKYAWRYNRVRSPLLRLPQEILPIILNDVVSDTRHDLSVWLTYGHICHDLRETLLGMHALWAEVVFNRRFIHVQDELLRRAGSSALSIELYSTSSARTIARALELLARARKISVDCSDRKTMRSVLNSLTRGQFEYLDTLQLSLRNGQGLLDGVFSGGAELVAPNLRVLSLEHMIIPFDASKLTTLSLYLFIETTPLQDAVSFTGALRRCAHLENLELWEWIPDCAILQTLHEDEAMVRLPRLSQLTMSQDGPRILQFWPFLDIPSSATLNITFTREDSCNLSQLLASGRALRAFVAHTFASGRSKISRLSLHYSENDEVVTLVLGAFSSSPLQSTPWNPLNSFAFTFATPMADLCLEKAVIFLECVCTSLQLRPGAIETLHYHFGDEIALFDEDESTEIESYLYTIFPAVTTLHLGYPGTNIKQILRPASWRGLDFFPNLQALHIRCTRSISRDDMENLIDTIRIRTTNHDTSIRVLSLITRPLNSEFTEEIETQCIQQLEALVPQFSHTISTNRW